MKILQGGSIEEYEDTNVEIADEPAQQHARPYHRPVPSAMPQAEWTNTTLGKAMP